MAQLRQRYSHLEVKSVRGNLNTRLKKLEDSHINEEGKGDGSGYSALLLAAAGMERMGWKEKIGQILEPSEQLYAVGQGALAIECRTTDHATLALLSPLHDRISALRVVAERSLLKALEGGCSAPVAVHSEYDDDTKVLKLQAGVWSLDGKKNILKVKTVDINDLDNIDPPPAKMARKDSTECRLFAGIAAGDLSAEEMEAAEKLGDEVAAELVEAGATPIMAAARAENELSEHALKLMKQMENIPGGSLCVAARLAAAKKY